VQRDLYNIMAEIAASKENAPRFRNIDASRVSWLETETDRISAKIQFPEGFILPGDTPASVCSPWRAPLCGAPNAA